MKKFISIASAISLILVLTSQAPFGKSQASSELNPTQEKVQFESLEKASPEVEVMDMDVEA